MDLYITSVNVVFFSVSVGSAVSSGAGSTRARVSVISARQDAIEGRVYLDLNNRAEASGTVYRWTYCYSADGDPPPYELVIAMYRRQQNGAYQLVPGSYRQLRITTPLGNSFDCQDIDLQTSEYFSVQTNDVVAVCEPVNVVRVELFFFDPTASLSGWNAGSCSSNRISTSGILSTTQTTFLLRASISKPHYEGILHVATILSESFFCHSTVFKVCLCLVVGDLSLSFPDSSVESHRKLFFLSKMLFVLFNCVLCLVL